jgi:AraC-like DNA-binding protein
VLHPDETHDGRAGSPEGFGYRIVYVAPARIQDAARAIRGRPGGLPFVREPVAANAALASAIEGAFRIDPEPLAIDTLTLRLAEALLDADPSSGGSATPGRLDVGALGRARQLLDAATTRVIRSSELEAITGLTRYDLARQFRSSFGTSPYRYSLLRRLDWARAQLGRNRSLADVALAAGFADQAHLTRMFKAAFGVNPARYRALDSECSRMGGV